LSDARFDAGRFHIRAALHFCAFPTGMAGVDLALVHANFGCIETPLKELHRCTA
jgi:hypothetical protein